MTGARATLDDAELDRFQRAAFEYFLNNVNPDNGLIPDTQRDGSPCSISVVGFVLSCYPVAVERGWIERAHAAKLTLAALRFFADSHQGPETDATGYQGFYYHFLDMKSGRRAWNCELSLIDSALLLAGVVAAGAWFDGADDTDTQIRRLAGDLYHRANWQWACDEQRTVRQGWTPETGFFHYDWEGYSEATILYVLAAASPGFPLGPESFKAWTRTYQWETTYGIECLYAGPLFIHLFSHAWIDFRGIQDGFAKQHGTDYFKNTAAAIRLQREYCRLNPGDFVGYDEIVWGLSACDGPSDMLVEESGRTTFHRGYAERGVPFGPDDGTLVPWAGLASLPFEPDLAAANHATVCSRYPQVASDHMFYGSYNPSLPGQTGDGPAGWVSPNIYGLDQGLVVLMIENYRTGAPWKLMRSCDIIRRGLRACGFTGGWLT